jgi:hypothetical protein
MLPCSILILAAGAFSVPEKENASAGAPDHVHTPPGLLVFFPAFFFASSSNQPHTPSSLFLQEPEDVPSQEKCSVRQQGEDSHLPDS